MKKKALSSVSEESSSVRNIPKLRDLSTPREATKHFAEWHDFPVKARDHGFFAVHRFLHRFGDNSHIHVEGNRRHQVPFSFSGKVKI
jgi:hypothetical protein